MQDKTLALYLVVMITAALSVAGAVLMAITVPLARRLSKLYWRLVFGLAIADFIQAFAMLAGAVSFLLFDTPFDDESGRAPWCIWQGLSIQFGSLSSSVYTFIICLVFYITIVKQQKIGWKWELFITFMAWVPSFALSIVPVAMPSINYADSGGWCWIGSSSFLMRFMLLYLWVGLNFFGMIGFYVLILSVFRADMNRPKGVRTGLAKYHLLGPASEKANVTSRFLVYPIVYLLMWLPAVLNRLYEGFSGDTNYVLTFLQSLVTPGMGFANALVYGITVGACGKAMAGHTQDNALGDYAGSRIPVAFASSSTASLNDDEGEEQRHLYKD